MNITGHTRLGCLLGSPVAHSLSPVMYNDCFRELNIDYVYLCFDIGQDKLEQTVRTLRDLNVFGFNVTMPDKEAVIPFLDDISPEAGLIGAVNTVKNEDGRFVGYNTDGMGYMGSLKAAGVDAVGNTMTLLGAGGAAGAIAIQAALDGVKKIHLASRHGKSWERALMLTERINHQTSCEADLIDLSDIAALQQAIEESVLLTNATSAGMAPHEDLTALPDPIVLPPQLAVSDIIYNPRQTKLLARAEEAGCRTMNGLGMLLSQGECAIRLWTGQEMPAELIRRRYFE